MTLESPDADWPPIDPEGWAVERNYRERNLAGELQRFLDLRATNLDWLRSLDEPDWSVEHTHPVMGSMRAGDILSAWAAHDLLHLRQLVKRRYELIDDAADSFDVQYAGAWGA